MKRACILTPRAGAGTEADPYHPQVVDEHAISKLRDDTGIANHNDPTGYPFAAIVFCSDEILADIENDNTYFVIWSSQADA